MLLSGTSDPAALDDAPTMALSDVPVSVSLGSKTLLFIRIAFADNPAAEPQTLASAEAMIGQVDQFMRANSFGRFSITPTFTSLVTLPQSEAWYKSAADGMNLLMADARQAARAANPAWDTAAHDLYIVRYAGGPGSTSGQAQVGSPGVWLRTSSAGVAAHELAHNLGLWHANAHDATGQTIIGPGINNEYGDPFDTMATSAGNAHHFNAWEKWALGWIPPANIHTATTDGIYRIFAHDTGAFDASAMYAIRIDRGDGLTFGDDAVIDGREYWIDFRQHSAWSGNRWVMNGVSLHWEPWSIPGLGGSSHGTQLLDTTPGSPDGKYDSALTLGRTFSDPLAGIHITPVAMSAGGWIDVRINFGVSAHAPAVSLGASVIEAAPGQVVGFTAAASDADGDELAYSWDFGDRTLGSNSPTTMKAWSTPGEYRVRVMVSAMRGGTASDSIIIRIGSPADVQLSGRVIDAIGRPVADVRIESGPHIAWTDTDGSYTLTNQSSAGITPSASKAGWTFTASGPDFIGTRTLYIVSGRITADGVTPVPGAAVSVGNVSTLTNAAGEYSVQLPPGAYAIHVAKAGMTFATRHVAVEYAAGRQDMQPVRHTVAGVITGLPVNTVVTISDGIISATAVVRATGVAYYSIPLLAGTRHVFASADGYELAPAGWTGPIELSAPRGNISFICVTSAFSVRGRLTRNSEPLAGMELSIGAHSTFTDSGGYYIVTGLGNGIYSVLPRLAGSAFSPWGANVTINGASVSGVDRDLDRPIDGDDYFALDRVHLGVSADTSGADMNFDGRIDGRDYFLLDMAFLTQLPLIPAAAAQPVPTPPDDEPADWRDLLK